MVPRFDSLGLTVTHVVERVTARAPRPYEVDALAIPIGVPVMSVERTYFAEDTVLETADLVVAGDNYTLNTWYRSSPEPTNLPINLADKQSSSRCVSFVNDHVALTIPRLGRSAALVRSVAPSLPSISSHTATRPESRR